MFFSISADWPSSFCLAGTFSPVESVASEDAKVNADRRFAVIVLAVVVRRVGQDRRVELAGLLGDGDLTMGAGEARQLAQLDAGGQLLDPQRAPSTSNFGFSRMAKPSLVPFLWNLGKPGF